MQNPPTWGKYKLSSFSKSTRNNDWIELKRLWVMWDNDSCTQKYSNNIRKTGEYSRFNLTLYTISILERSICFLQIFGSIANCIYNMHVIRNEEASQHDGNIRIYASWNTYSFFYICISLLLRTSLWCSILWHHIPTMFLLEYVTNGIIEYLVDKNFWYQIMHIIYNLW